LIQNNAEFLQLPSAKSDHFPAFLLQLIFPTSPSERTPWKPSCSINVRGSVCVNVCGVSARRLRHVSLDADGVNWPIKQKVIFVKGNKNEFCQLL